MKHECTCTYIRLVSLGYVPKRHHPTCPRSSPHNPETLGDEAKPERLVGGQTLTTPIEEEHTT